MVRDQVALVDWRSGRTAVLFLELANAPGSIDDLLLTRVKGMAGRTDFNMQFLAQRGPGFKTVATGTDHLDGVVGWMNFWLHNKNRWGCSMRGPRGNRMIGETVRGRKFTANGSWI